MKGWGTGAALETQNDGGKGCQKSFATTWKTRFFTRFFSPLRGEHVFFKKLWGIFPYVPPSSAATGGELGKLTLIWFLPIIPPITAVGVFGS